MAGIGSPGRSTTHASNDSAVSFGGLVARSCPAQFSHEESVSMVGCELHSTEATLTPAAFRSALRQKPLAKSGGDMSPCVSVGNASRAGSQGSARSKRTPEGPPRTPSQKRSAEAAQGKEWQCHYLRRCQGWSKQKGCIKAGKQGRRNQQGRPEDPCLPQEAILQRRWTRLCDLHTQHTLQR